VYKRQINNFLLDDRWAFRSRHLSLVRFFKFNLAALGAMVVTATTVWVLAQQAGVNYLIANLFGIASSAVLNFLVSATWIWGEKRRSLSHPPAVPGDRRVDEVAARLEMPSPLEAQEAA